MITEGGQRQNFALGNSTLRNLNVCLFETLIIELRVKDYVHNEHPLDLRSYKHLRKLTYKIDLPEDPSLKQLLDFEKAKFRFIHLNRSVNVFQINFHFSQFSMLLSSLVGTLFDPKLNILNLRMNAFLYRLKINVDSE